MPAQANALVVSRKMVRQAACAVLLTVYFTTKRYTAMQAEVLDDGAGAGRFRVLLFTRPDESAAAARR